MKKLAMAVLGAALLSQTAGCFIFVDDSGDEGQFHATWTVMMGGASTCAAVGASTVQFLSTEAATGDLYIDTYNCDDYAGTTDGMPLGEYSVVINIRDSAGTVLNLPMTPIVDTLDVDGEIVELGNVVYTFTPPTTDVALYTLWGTATATDCNSHGVVQEQVYLDDGSACISFTLTNQYDNGTTCGDAIVCEDGAVAQTISDVDYGTYNIEVMGLKSATGGYTCICYHATGSITVSATGNSFDIDVPFDSAFDTSTNCWDGTTSKCDATK
jgi:hypothetical protein